LGSEAKNNQLFWQLPTLSAKPSIWRRYSSLPGKAWTQTARGHPWRCSCDGQCGK